MTKILVVDDNAFQRKKITAIIADKFEVTIIEASDGIEALNQIDQEKPDLIFSDIVMPNMDGIELLTELQCRGITTPVIMLTSDIEAEQKEKCRTLGAKAFLGKPPKEDKIILVITKILNL